MPRTDNGLRRSARLARNVKSRNRAVLSSDTSKTVKYSSTKPKKVPRVAPSAVRRTTSLEDPASAPVLDRPFIIYGLNNQPYFVNAHPLSELLTNVLGYPVVYLISIDDMHDASPHANDPSPSPRRSFNVDEEASYKGLIPDPPSLEASDPPSLEASDPPSVGMLYITLSLVHTLTPSLQADIDLSSYQHGIEVGMTMALSGSAIGPNLARNRKRRATRRLNKHRQQQQHMNQVQ